jgi:hypothetical protein
LLGTLAAGIETSPLGRRIAPDGSGSVTTADSVEMTVRDPIEFRAVTLKRILRFRSLSVSRYERLVAPEIDAQSPPAELQRSQRYENEIGCRPDQAPGSAVTTCPTSIVPRGHGGWVFTGGPTTTAVGFEATVCEPSAFVAVTRTLIRKPTSADLNAYLELVASETMAQSPPSGRPPSAPQRTHT